MNGFLGRAAAGVLAVGLLGGAAATAFAQPLEDVPYAFAGERCESFSAGRPDQLVDAWHLQRLRMDDVWPLATGKGVKVAVIDTGVSTVGSVYFDRSRISGQDFIGRSEDEINKRAKVDCLHGTAVASIIAAGLRDGGPMHQSTNFSGIAPEAEILFYRALADSAAPEGDAQDVSLEPVVRAVDQAVADGTQIINLSLTVPRNVAFFDEFEAAVKRAVAANVLVVAAAGNSAQPVDRTQPQPPLYPASFPGVIAVGMTTPGDAAHQMSYAWSSVTVGAPGTDIIALAPSHATQGTVTSANQAFHTDTGTSYAAPVVSGVLALMLEYDAAVGREPLTPATARERLAATADPPPAAAPDDQLGNGIVNPMRALLDTRPDAESSETAAPPPPEPSEEPEPTDATMPALGLGIAVVSVLLVGGGVVAAIAIPAAARRR